MDVAALIAQLESDGPRLAAAAQRAGWDAAVPGTGWTVRELVTHVGGIHRWAADIVASGQTSFDTPAGAAVGTGPDDAELVAWFVDGHAALVRSLRSAGDDLKCATFLPADSPRHFWCRRQAHETAVHRADAEAAGGPVTPLPAEFAQDGMAELLDGFARRRGNAVAVDAAMGLDAADGPSWLVRFGGDRIEATRTEELAASAVTIRGRSSDLYLWLWNRPSEAVVEGDGAVAAVWTETVRIRWG